MSKFPIYNPGTDEAISPPLGGMSNAISLVSELLNMKTSTLIDSTMSEVFIDEADRFRIFAVPVEFRGWLESPSPVIKKNGSVITPESDGFKLHHMGGCIEFIDESKRPIQSDTITVSATYVNGDSTRLLEIESLITSLQTVTGSDRGNFISYEDMVSGVSNPKPFDRARVFGEVFDIYFYDADKGEWVSVTENDVASLQTQIDELKTGKEPSIGTKNTAFNKNFGTGNQEVMRGDFAYSKENIDTYLLGKEPLIGEKGTAFNKDFGDVEGTVAPGTVGKPIFTEAATLENIVSQESLPTLFGKIKKWFSSLGDSAFASIANNLTTTTEGNVLDARQGKSLGDSVTALNNRLKVFEIPYSFADTTVETTDANGRTYHDFSTFGLTSTPRVVIVSPQSPNFFSSVYELDNSASRISIIHRNILTGNTLPANSLVRYSIYVLK